MKRVRALVVAHDARATGGVNNFLRIMRKRYRPRVDATRFANGRRHGETGSLRALKRLLTDYIRFCVVISRRSFDIVHVNPSLDTKSMPRELLFVFLTKIFSPRTKVVIFYRGWDWQAVDALRNRPVFRGYVLAANKIADRCLVLADEFKNALSELGVEDSKSHVVTTMFEGEVLRAVLDSAENKLVHKFCFMSRFLQAKRGDLVLKGFAAVREQHPGVELIMAGDGPEANNLKQLASELGLNSSEVFPGYLSPKEKMKLLAESGLFLLPTSHPEGMPNAILEAMAAGCVVISTRVGGIPDIVADGESGELIPEGDLAALTAAMLRYLEDSTYRENAMALNRQRAWSLWESTIVSNNIANHYDTVLAIGGRRG